MNRSENAIERSADRMYDMLEWSSPKRTPAAAGFHVTRDRIEPHSQSRRTLFTGRFWMADEPVAAWRPTAGGDRPIRPVSELAKKAANAGSALRPSGRRGELIAGDGGPAAVQVAKSFGELSLVPLDGPSNEERATVEKLASLELRVEVVRFSRPAASANGVSTGKVLAVSENYAAQQLGAGHVVIHDNRNLDRPLSLGEKATIGYEGGKGTVYDGLAHDINIDASWMPRDQQMYMRMVMLDALSMMKEPQQDDERLRDAMRYALESTANFFGLSESRLRRADIKLMVNDAATTIKAEGSPSATPRANRP